MAGLVQLCSVRCQYVTHFQGLDPRETGSLTCFGLVAECGLGPPLQLVAGTPMKGLTIQLLGFLTAQWLGFHNEGPKRQKVKATGFLSPGPRRLHSIPFTVFYWSSSDCAESNRGDIECNSQCRKCQKPWGHVFKPATLTKKANNSISP